MLLVSLGALVGVLIGLAIAFSGSTSYRSTGTVLLSDPGVVEPGSSGLDNQQKLNLLAFTYVEVVTLDSFVDKALRGVDPDPAELAVAATTVKNTPTIEVGVSAPDPERAVDAARALVSSLQDAPADVVGASASSVDVLAIDLTAAQRVSTDRTFVVVAGLVAGLVIAGMFALLLETQ